MSVLNEEKAREEALTMRRKGMSWREIGARYGMSHEHARSLLLPYLTAHDRENVAHMKSVRAREEVSEWLLANGPVTREQVYEQFPWLTSGRLSAMITSGLNGSYMILSPDRTQVTDSQFTDDEMLDALRQTWETLKSENPRLKGMSTQRYNSARATGLPGAARIGVRMGSWVDACKRAGVPHGSGRRRGKDSYKSLWTNDELLQAIRDFVVFCNKTRLRPTYIGYDAWQRDQENYPSGSTLRNRLRESGLDAWADMVQAATEMRVK